MERFDQCNRFVTSFTPTKQIESKRRKLKKNTEHFWNF